MDKPQNPHDGFFKATFSDIIIMSDYLRNELSEAFVAKIHFGTLALCNASYITSELQEFFSDIVYECEFGDKKIKISLLFEHKSVPPKYPHIQLLRYMIEAWTRAIENKEPPQVIVPIIVYHGKRKWEKRKLETYFKDIDPLLQPFIPSFDYLLTDLKNVSDEDILAMNAGLLRNTLLLFKHYGEDEYIRNSIKTLFIDTEPFSNEDPSRNKIRSFLVYLWTTSNIQEDEFKDLLTTLPRSIKETTMTTYEQIILKGEKKGVKKGKIEGKIEKENLFIKNTYKKGFDLETIAELTVLSVEEVEKRIAEMGI